MIVRFEYNGKKFKSVERKNVIKEKLSGKHGCYSCYFFINHLNCDDVPDDCVNNFCMIYVEDKNKPKRYKIKQDIEYVEPILLFNVDAVNNIVEEILKRTNAFQIF